MVKTPARIFVLANSLSHILNIWPHVYIDVHRIYSSIHNLCYYGGCAKACQVDWRYILLWDQHQTHFWWLVASICLQLHFGFPSIVKCHKVVFSKWYHCSMFVYYSSRYLLWIYGANIDFPATRLFVWRRCWSGWSYGWVSPSERVHRVCTRIILSETKTELRKYIIVFNVDN